MIEFQKLTEQEQKDADRILSIEEAKKRSPKGESHVGSFVSWGNSEPIYLDPLEEIISIRLAIPPDLPYGYYMQEHPSWREWSLAANNRLVDLCKTAPLEEIYNFYIVVERYISEVRNKYKIRLSRYWEPTYNGHEKPKFPKDLYVFGLCEEENKKLQSMTGHQIYEQLMTISPRDESSHAWLNEMDITGTTIDGQQVLLKNSDIDLTKIASVCIKVLHEREYTDPYFHE
jgi:hypothetical protein